MKKLFTICSVALVCASLTVQAQTKRKTTTVKRKTTTTTTTRRAAPAPAPAPPPPPARTVVAPPPPPPPPSAPARRDFSAGGPGAFEKNTQLIGLGIGTGYYYGGYTNRPAFIITYEHGLVGNVGPGTIGLGGIVSVSSGYYDYGFGTNYRTSFVSTAIAVRGTYHLTILKTKNRQFDPYGGVSLGLRINNSSNNFGNGFTYDEPNSITPVFGPFVGARYNFAQHFGAWAELGFDTDFAKIGLSYKF